MALADPLQILAVLFVILAIPVIIVYWIVRLAARRELERRPVRTHFDKRGFGPYKSE